MKTMQILDALKNVDDEYLLQAKADDTAVLARKSRRLRILVLAAAVIALLTVSGYAVYHVGLINGW